MQIEHATTGIGLYSLPFSMVPEIEGLDSPNAKAFYVIETMANILGINIRHYSSGHYSGNRTDYYAVEGDTKFYKTQDFAVILTNQIKQKLSK
jgi:hypothetical protein